MADTDTKEISTIKNYSSNKIVQIPFNVGDNAYYLDDNKIYKFSIYQIEVKITAELEQNSNSDSDDDKVVNTIYCNYEKIIDTHFRNQISKYNGNNNQLGIQQSIDQIFDLINGKTILREIKNKIDLSNYKISLGQKYYIFADGGIKKVWVKSLLLTITKSLNNFVETTETDYTLIDDDDNEYTLSEIGQIYDNEDDLKTDVEENQIYYVGCDVCNV